MCAIFWVCVVAVFIFLLCLFLMMPKCGTKKNRAGFSGTLYAHRGLHNNDSDAPENSLLAFKKAIDAGYGIELDVQLSKDDVAVVFHDYTLNRVCGIDAKIEELTWDELSKIKLCNSEQTIPKFSDVLDLVAGKVPLIVEIKGESTDTHMCEVADKFLREYNGVYCIESFNPMAVLWYKKNRREVVRGQLSDAYLREPIKKYHGVLYFVLQNLFLNFLTKPDFIAFNHKYANFFPRKICRALFKNNAAAWTIKNQQQLEDAKNNFDIFIFDSFVPEETDEKFSRAIPKR